MSEKKFRKIIVHVGQMKTGTTQIQNTLFNNSAKLAEFSILYPAEGLQTKGHHSILRLLSGKADEFKSITEYGAPGDEAVIMRILQDAPATDTLILSSEQLFLAVQQLSEKLREFDLYLNTLSSDVRYMAYVREPVSQYPSMASQILMRSTLLPRFDWTYKLSSLVTFKNLFRERFSVRVYDRKMFKEGDVLNDFLINVVGLGTGAKGFEPAAEPNVSLSAEGMYLVQSMGLLNQLREPSNFPNHGEQMHKVASFIRWAGSKQVEYVSATLKEDVIDMIKTATHPQLELLDDNFGIRFDVPPTKPVVGPKQHALFHQLVKNVFQVDADRTAKLIDNLLSRQRLPDDFRYLLASIPLPVN